MTNLKTEIIEAHGGLARWKRFTELKAHLKQGGALWAIKGQAGVLDDTWVTVSLTEERAAHAPFGTPGRHSLFTPDRVALFGQDGALEQELFDPRASFRGHTLETPWNALQLAYFAGIAMWTYLNTPFLLAWDGMETEELAPWEENGQHWRRLKLTYPDHIPSHSKVQTLYVGDDGLIRRHDYDVEIAGNTPGAHYLSDYVEIEGLMFPTKRRIFPRQPDGQAMSEPLVVSIDLDSIELR